MGWANLGHLHRDVGRQLGANLHREIVLRGLAIAVAQCQKLDRAKVHGDRHRESFQGIEWRPNREPPRAWRSQTERDSHSIARPTTSLHNNSECQFLDLVPQHDLGHGLTLQAIKHRCHLTQFELHLGGEHHDRQKTKYPTVATKVFQTTPGVRVVAGCAVGHRVNGSMFGDRLGD